MSETGVSEMAGRAALYTRLARVMGRAKRIQKRGRNSHFDYSFATQDDVYDFVRGAMAAEGVAFLPRIVSIEDVEFETARGTRTKTRVTFEFSFCDGETGYCEASRWVGEAMDDQDKSISKASANAEKYFLLRTFVLSTGDDQDPDASGEVNGARRRGRRGNGAERGEPVVLAGAENFDPELVKPAGERDWNGYYMVTAKAFGYEREAAAEILKEAGQNTTNAWAIMRSRWEKKRDDGK